MNFPLFFHRIPQVFRRFPWYPATYCTLTLSGAMTVFTFSFVDGLFLCGCMYMSGLFNMLQYDIRQAFAELKDCKFECVCGTLGKSIE